MLIRWIPQNIAWIRLVTKELLEHRKIELHNYLQALITPNFLYDKIGIKIVARMCHLQVAIVLKGKIWLTNHPSKAKKRTNMQIYS